MFIIILIAAFIEYFLRVLIESSSGFLKMIHFALVSFQIANFSIFYLISFTVFFFDKIFREHKTGVRIHS